MIFNLFCMIAAMFTRKAAMLSLSTTLILVTMWLSPYSMMNPVVGYIGAACLLTAACLFLAAFK